MSVSVSFVYNEQNYKFESNSTKSTFGQIIEFLYKNGYDFQSKIHNQPTRKLLNEEEYQKILATSSYSPRNFYKIKDEKKYIISNYNSYLIEAFVIQMLVKFGVEKSSIKTNGFEVKSQRIKKFGEIDEDDLDEDDLDEDDMTPVVEEPIDKIKTYKQNPFKQAICVLGSPGVGKSVTIRKLLRSEGHIFQIWEPTAATTGLLSQFSPSKSSYIPSKIGNMLIAASENPENLYTFVIDEFHKSSVIEMVNDELKHAISLRRYEGDRFISNEDSTSYLSEYLEEDDGGNLRVPDNFGFIFISSKPRVIVSNGDIFDRIDIVILKHHEEEEIKSISQLKSKILDKEEKSKLEYKRGED